MIMYVVTVLILLATLMNYLLGALLYKEPKNSSYYTNVKLFHVMQQKDIMTKPQYVFGISALLGIFFGIYIFLSFYMKINGYMVMGTVLLLGILYLIEITRKITLTEDELVFEKMFMKPKTIPLEQIDGLYVYSFNKRFLNKNAFTTKLVVTANRKKYKYTLGGIDTKAVLNMLKDNFGITENKMFIAKK